MMCLLSANLAPSTRVSGWFVPGYVRGDNFMINFFGANVLKPLGTVVKWIPSIHKGFRTDVETLVIAD